MNSTYSIFEDCKFVCDIVVPVLAVFPTSKQFNSEAQFALLKEVCGALAKLVHSPNGWRTVGVLDKKIDGTAEELCAGVGRGNFEGQEKGCFEGCRVGCPRGCLDGFEVGFVTGRHVGCLVG